MCLCSVLIPDPISASKHVSVSLCFYFSVFGFLDYGLDWCLPGYLCVPVYLCITVCIDTLCSCAWVSIYIYLLVFILLCFSIFTIVTVRLFLGDLVFFSLPLCLWQGKYPKMDLNMGIHRPSKRTSISLDLCSCCCHSGSLSHSLYMCVSHVYFLSFQNLMSYVSKSPYHTVSPSMSVLLLVSYFVWFCVSGCMYMCVFTSVPLAPFLFIHLFIQQIFTKHLFIIPGTEDTKWFRKCPCP